MEKIKKILLWFKNLNLFKKLAIILLVILSLKIISFKLISFVLAFGFLIFTLAFTIKSFKSSKYIKVILGIILSFIALTSTKNILSTSSSTISKSTEIVSTTTSESVLNDTVSTTNSDNTLEKSENSSQAEKEKIGSTIVEDIAKKEEEFENIAFKKNTQQSTTSQSTANVDNKIEHPKTKMVYKTETGSKYHSHAHCGKTNSSNTTELTIEEAKSKGLTPCKKCF